MAADAFDIYMIKQIRGFAFGLAGADLVIVTQFINDARIAQPNMAGLVALVPIMTAAGLMAEVVGGSERHEVAWFPIILFVFALSVNMLCLIGTFYNISHLYGVAFAIGI